MTRPDAARPSAERLAEIREWYATHLASPNIADLLTELAALEADREALAERVREACLDIVCDGWGTARTVAAIRSLDLAPLLAEKTGVGR